MPRASFDEPIRVNGASFSREECPKLASYPAPTGQAYLVTHLVIPEFSCLVPGSRMPLTGVLNLSYVPNKLCVDLHALRMYVLTFRDKTLTEEVCVQDIASVLIRHLQPWWLELSGQFNGREGLPINPVATYQAPQELQA